MRTRAIVLKKQNTNEYDQLITCYTEEFGKVTAIAKSVLKQNSIQAMHLDVFHLVDFELINGRGVPIITGAQVEAVYSNLKSNLSPMAIAYFFAEVIDGLFFEYQKDEELWKFLHSFLSELDSGPISIGEFTKQKQIKFLDILGYLPNINQCVFCRTSMVGQLVAYSVENRGAICQNCFLGGQRGIVLKNEDFFDLSIIGSIFEDLVEKRLYSLSFLQSVL